MSISTLVIPALSVIPANAGISSAITTTSVGRKE